MAEEIGRYVFMFWINCDVVNLTVALHPHIGRNEGSNEMGMYLLIPTYLFVAMIFTSIWT